jgi:hypothetical protein
MVCRDILKHTIVNIIIGVSSFYLHKYLSLTIYFDLSCFLGYTYITQTTKRLNVEALKSKSFTLLLQYYHGKLQC